MSICLCNFIYKSLFFFPFVISQVVVGLIFTWFYAPNFGLFSVLIKDLTGMDFAADGGYSAMGPESHEPAIPKLMA